ncbi:Uncharacterised protein [Shigella sonnei]|nr:Uncharacterised protein [Shigella sonnei]
MQADQCRQFGERLSVKMRSQSGTQGIIDCWRCDACGFGVLQRQPFFIAKERVLPPVSHCQQFIAAAGTLGDFHTGDIHTKLTQAHLRNARADKRSHYRIER